jgi:hypothetical protein
MTQLRTVWDVDTPRPTTTTSSSSSSSAFSQTNYVPAYRSWQDGWLARRQVGGCPLLHKRLSSRRIAPHDCCIQGGELLRSIQPACAMHGHMGRKRGVVFF